MGFGPLLAMADRLMLYKYVVKNVAVRHGKTVTFMPKPIFQDNGSGMHVHQSLWKDGEPLMWDELGYAQLSDTARWYIGGMLEHAPALLALCAPTTNSYKRLVPGYEAPVNLVYSQRNRSRGRAHPAVLEVAEVQAHRVPLPGPERATRTSRSRRCSWPDSTGSRTRSSRPIRSTRTSTSCRRRSSPRSRRCRARSTQALDALEDDHDFLLEGGVFTQDVIDALDRLQASARSGRDAAAPPPVGVLPLLRHLVPATGTYPWRPRSRPGPLRGRCPSVVLVQEKHRPCHRSGSDV